MLSHCEFIPKSKSLTLRLLQLQHQALFLFEGRIVLLFDGILQLNILKLVLILLLRKELYPFVLVGRELILKLDLELSHLVLRSQQLVLDLPLRPLQLFNIFIADPVQVELVDDLLLE